MGKIILASNNAHKIKEFRTMFPHDEVFALKDIGYIEEIVEDGTTFVENSMIKAKAVMQYLKDRDIVASVIADDSGLCVNALGGKPGIHSARYSGDHDDAKNRAALLNNLKDCSDRSAYFVCTLVKLYPNGEYLVAEGRTYGKIVYEEMGDTSFGYDYLFVSDELGKTFGQATKEEKNSISHRGRAIQKLKELMNEYEQ